MTKKFVLYWVIVWKLLFSEGEWAFGGGDDFWEEVTGSGK